MKKVAIPSPAISIVGRHNSGKTTCIERLIAELVSRGHDVGSIKHHSHAGFEIDHEGKDSFRHRRAGTSETIISAPGQIACIKTINGEMECDDLIKLMPNHDVVIVEGYRKSGLPMIEVMRAANEADEKVAAIFVEGAEKGWSLETDFIQMARIADKARDPIDARERDEAQKAADARETVGKRKPDIVNNIGRSRPIDISDKLPQPQTVAIITDIEEVFQAAETYGIKAFELNDTKALADFIVDYYVRPRLTVVIQAGGESRRMGRSKATVPFMGRPLISRIVERLAPVADELIITTNEPENLEFLDTEFPQLDIKRVRDVFDKRGALPGLYTALEASTSPFVAVVACDMILASPALAVAEADIMARKGADAVVPVNRHGYEPFHAVFRKDSCLPAVKELMDEGENKAQALFRKVNVYEFSQEQVLEVEPMGGCFINVNTPDDLAALERSLLE